MNHLYHLIAKEWKLQSFHLLGHSWGGILAYEFLKKFASGNNRNNNYNCQSLILSSTPTSIALLLQESMRLYQQLQEKEYGAEKDAQEEDEDGGDCDNDNTDYDDTARSTTKPKSKPTPKQYAHFASPVFQQTHECRLEMLPLALQDAMQQAGPVEWRGLPAIEGWSVEGRNGNGKDDGKDNSKKQGDVETSSDDDDDDDDDDDAERSGDDDDDDAHSHNDILPIPTSLLRGEYDFCTATCMEEWKHHVNVIKTVVLQNCSHYGMLEDERQYGQAVMEFLQGIDNDDAL